MRKTSGGSAAEIACRQILHKDYSVFSAQWTVVPNLESGPLQPDSLLERYLHHVRRATWSVVRPHRGEGTIEFRLFGTRLSLLTFAGPSFSRGTDGDAAILRLTGGILVHPGNCRRGELTFTCAAVLEGIRAGIHLSDYCPLLLGVRPGPLRRTLYRLTQATIHRLVTVRFLVRLQRELAGRRVCCRMVRMRVPGEDNI